MTWLFLLYTASAGPDVYAFGDGHDGAGTISGRTTVPKGLPITSAPMGGTSVQLAGPHTFQVGMLVFLHQTRGPTVAPEFNIPALDIDLSVLGVGQYEFARITSVANGSVVVDAPLLHGYVQGAQLVRVQEFSNLSVPAGATLSTQPWDGMSGGIAVVAVRGTLTLDGTIEANGAGFRGGDGDSFPSSNLNSCVDTMDSNNAGAKGEGVGGGIGIGLGSIANGGGGGNCGNAGGAGGGGIGSGGRGGNTWAGYGGLVVGGIGGAGTHVDWTQRLGLGGGGGAGEGNDNGVRPGGAGGGLIVVRAGAVVGAGQLQAKGADAPEVHIDGASGGGAGGTVIVQADGLACAQAAADGGGGGDVITDYFGTSAGNHGPGGGGGGGRVVLQGGGACAGQAVPGLAGVNSDVTGQPSYGAEPGTDGEVVSDENTAFPDGDGDGFRVGPDCDDLDPAVNPGAAEACNLIDDNCDGNTDDNTVNWWLDGDGDGVGAGTPVVASCTAPSPMLVLVAGDCDDADATRFPGAADDTCDAIDQDCDGEVDEDAARTAWYGDSDVDGFGAGLATYACINPPGWVANHTDCDDHNPDRHPNAQEICNSMDDDCDGLVDEDAVDRMNWYFDGDGDGVGAGPAVLACDAPNHHVLQTEDCDDGDATIFPGAHEEDCNRTDNDCDGSVDEHALYLPYYLDADGDGFGAGHSFVDCAAPLQHVLDNTDCDDHDPLVNTAANEVCNGYDDDCDQAVDEGLLVLFWPDTDGDGFGSSTAHSIEACEAPFGHSGNNTDCDDGITTIFPDAEEVCNGADDDCDGEVDEGSAPLANWYIDSDGDGWGGSGVLAACVEPPGYTLNPGDCDDVDPMVFPYQQEVCNGHDDDCDGAIDTDSDVVGTTQWYTDQDLDGYGADPFVEACDPPTGLIADGSDCDDLDPHISPAENEICNEIDDDCDGLVDAADASLHPPPSFIDHDGDGYGVDLAPACEGVPLGQDCDDDDPSIYPGATEVVGDSVDQDCDGVDGTVEPPDPTGDTSEPEPTDTDPPTVLVLPNTGCGCDAGSSTPLWLWGLVGVLLRRQRVMSRSTNTSRLGSPSR